MKAKILLEILFVFVFLCVCVWEGGVERGIGGYVWTDYSNQF